LLVDIVELYDYFAFSVHFYQAAKAIQRLHFQLRVSVAAPFCQGLCGLGSKRQFDKARICGFVFIVFSSCANGANGSARSVTQGVIFCWCVQVIEALD